MSAYSSLILAKASLSGYWRMGEASGTTLTDASANALNGTIAATGITYSVTGPLANDANTALTFDASSDPASVPDNALLDVADGPFWIAFWFKRSATQGANQTIVTKGTNAYQVRFSTLDQLGLFRLGGGNSVRTEAITDQNWHFAVFQKNGSSRQAYLDGADVSVLGTDSVFADTSTTFRIGWATAGGQRYPGSLDEVAIGKGAVLSAAEVLELYNVGKGLIGVASETDSAQALDKDKSSTRTAATETDTAQALVYTKPIFKSLTAATETDSATAADIDKAATLTPAVEADTAQALDADKPISKSLGSATETDAAQALTFSNAESYGITSATEADTAQPLSFTKPIYKALTPAEETDSAQDLGYAQAGSFSIGAVDETDTAQPLSIAQVHYRTLTPAVETDEAQPFTLQPGTPVGPLPTGGFTTPRRIPVRQRLAITPAQEIDTALQLVVTKTPSRIQIEDDELLMLV